MNYPHLDDLLVWPERAGLRCENCGRGFYHRRSGFARLERDDWITYVHYMGPACNHCDDRWGGLEAQRAEAVRLYQEQNPGPGDAWEPSH